MLHSAIQPRIDELAFYDSGLRIVRHFWFVETKPEFATLHCVRVSPDWGGYSEVPTSRSGIARNRDAPLRFRAIFSSEPRYRRRFFPSAAQLRASRSLRVTTPVRND